MKRTLILSLIACGASLMLVPGIHAQDASNAPATTGTDAGGGGRHRGGGPGGPGGGGGGLTIERLTQELDLTTDEQTAIKPILDTLHTTMQSVHQDTTSSQDDKMAKMKEARDTAVAGINAVLTDDQKTKFAAMMAKRGGGRRGGPGGANSAPPATTGS